MCHCRPFVVFLIYKDLFYYRSLLYEGNEVLINSTVKLYCERSILDRKSKGYNVIFDFHSKKDLESVMKARGIRPRKNNGYYKNLISIVNLKVKPYKGPRSGFWYEVPLEYLKDFQESEKEVESSLIFLQLNGRSLKESDFLKLKIIGPYRESGKLATLKSSKLWLALDQVKKQDFTHTLIVRNVGCGNLNEVIMKNTEGNQLNIIYDFGYDVKAPDKEVTKVINHINLNEPTYGIISHWDLDHYRVLLNMEPKQINMIKSMLVPSKMPDTLSLENTLRLLRINKIPVEVLNPAPRTEKYIELVSQGVRNGIEIYRSMDGTNINQSGIVMTITGKNSIAVLTGDHHYRQLTNSVFSNHSGKEYTMVVPHHGGQAGNFKVSDWDAINWRGGAISTQSGRYRNLPRYDIYNFFINKRFHCTNHSNSDYRTTL